MHGRTVLVTGGAGFIGSYLVHKLVADGARVRVLDNLTAAMRQDSPRIERAVEFQEGDIRNAVACRKACRGVEMVFHLAAAGSVPTSVRDPIATDAVNIGGTLNILQAARDSDVRRFVFASSAAVYGDAPILPTPENSLLCPRSPYGVAKLYGEHMARLFDELHGLETVSLRCFNVYGPGHTASGDSMGVIPKFVSALASGIRPTIYGDGEQTRDFVFVEDVVRAMILAARMDNPAGAAVNIASGRAVSLNRLYAILAELAKGRKRPLHEGARIGDIRHSHADITLARKRLDFEPQTELESGLESIMRFYREAAAA